MNVYRTSAIVDEHGRVIVTGVPFADGTEVDVTITPMELVKDVKKRPEDGDQQTSQQT